MGFIKMIVIIALGLLALMGASSHSWAVEPMVSVGSGQACSLDEDGRILNWGLNSSPELTLPKELVNKKWKAVSAGSSHICAILESGLARCWGNSSLNQTILPLGFENAKWQAISAGGAHSCGILEKSREAKCWGGVLEYNQTEVPSGLVHAKWKAISVGSEHTCAILESGEAKCWGDTNFDKTTLRKGFENAKWKTISAGDAHSCGILEDGRAQCWGWKYPESRLEKTSLPDGLEDVKWKTISAGNYRTCGLLENGEARCWGELKEGLIPSPSELENMKWKAISTGGSSTCAILANGETVYCWDAIKTTITTVHLLPEYPFGISNLELGLGRLMAVVSPVKKAFLGRVLEVLNKLKKPDERLNLTNLNAFKLRLFLLNALGPFMEDLSSAYEKEHVVPKYLVAREQANIENEIKCLADLDCNASLKILSLELIQITVEALKGQTASNEDHALMENLTAELGKSLAQGGENLSQVMGIFDSAPGKKLIGAFAQSPFTRGFGLMLESLVEYLRGAR